jgi:hypothetical protein
MDIQEKCFESEHLPQTGYILRIIIRYIPMRHIGQKNEFVMHFVQEPSQGGYRLPVFHFAITDPFYALNEKQAEFIIKFVNDLGLDFYNYFSGLGIRESGIIMFLIQKAKKEIL